MVKPNTYALLMIFMQLLFVLSSLAQPGGKADSLLSLLRTAKEDTHKVNVLNSLSEEYFNINAKDAFGYAQGALQLARKLSYVSGIALSCDKIAKYYWMDGDYPNALSFLYEKLRAYEQLRDKKGIAGALGNIGIILRYKGDYPSALKYYLKALKIDEELNNKPGISRDLGNIGLVYNDLGDYVKALEHHEKALKLDEELGNKSGVARHLGNMGTAYYNEKKYNEALEYYLEALRLDKEIGNKNGIAIRLGNTGSIYSDLASDSTAAPGARKDAFEKALGYYLEALQLREELGNKNYVAVSLSSIGGLYARQGKLSEAVYYCRKSLSLARQSSYKEVCKANYKSLADVYAMHGKHREALESYKLYISYRDSMLNEENTKKQTRMEMQYAFDKQQAADSIKNAEALKQESLKHQQEVEQQKLYTYGGSAGFFLMLVVAGVSYNAYRQKQKANGIISQQKLLVEEKQKEILDSIHYARRIQRSLLPTEKYIAKKLANFGR